MFSTTTDKVMIYTLFLDSAGLDLPFSSDGDFLHDSSPPMVHSTAIATETATPTVVADI